MELPTSARERWFCRFGPSLLAGAGLCIGILAFFPDTIFTGFEQVQTDSEDSLHLQYMMEHELRWFSDPTYTADFWSPQFFYPTPRVLAYSENMLGTAPLYWLLRTACSPQVAIQWWVLILAACNYLAMFIVLRWLGINAVLATLGAYVFAFSLPRSVHQPNLLTLPQCFTPFAMYYFREFVRRPRRRHFLLLLITLGWQVLASIHLGWFLGFALGSWLVAIYFHDRSTFGRLTGFVRTYPAFTVAAAGIWAASLVSFFRYYLWSGVVPLEFFEAAYYSPTVENWFAAVPTSLWAPRPLVYNDWHDRERFLFAGSGLYLILFIGFLFGWENRRRPETRERAMLAWTTALTCGWLMLITLNLGRELCFWYPIYAIMPGAGGLRAIDRVVFIVIPLILMGGLGAVQSYAEAELRNPTLRWLLYSLLLIVCVVEQVRISRRHLNRHEIDARSLKLAQEMRDADVTYFMRDPHEIGTETPLDAAAMWASMKANRPTVNGYSSREPTNYVKPNKYASLEELLRYLGESWHGRLAVVHLAPPYRTELYEVRAGTDGVGRATLIRVTPSAAR